MLTKEQLEVRKLHITGSDAGIICGVNNYSTPYRLWAEKTGRMESEDISEKPAVKAGNMLESAIRHWFEYETNKKVSIENDFLIHVEHKWMGANIDGYIEEENAIFEAKTAGSANGWGEDGENIIPPTYLLQVAHYCAVKNADKAYIAVLIKGSDFRVYTYERDLELEKVLIEKEKTFYDCMINDTPPDFENSNDIVLHYGKSKTQEVVANEDIVKMCCELKDARKAIKELEAKEIALKLEINAFMKESDALVDTFGKKLATWKSTKERKIFNAKKLESESPDIYSKYVEIKDGYRAFLLK